MRTACLINHFKYGEFIAEAVDSVLRQTRALDEIVLVDDGSPAGDLERVREAAARDPRIRLIEKDNGGQLSCFQVGLAELTADVVFFLDADDAWEPEYVARVAELLEARPDLGFVAVNVRTCFADGKEEVAELESRDLGFSVVRCLQKGGAWVGAPTSCLAIRREVLDKIFPVPDPRAWRVCADEALVYGSSLAGARKYVIGDPLVRYRVHDRNAFFGSKDSPERAYMRRLEGRRLVEHMRQRLSLPASLIDLVHYEFRTIERPTKTEYSTYWGLVRNAPIPWARKLRLYSGLFSQYRLGRKARRP